MTAWSHALALRIGISHQDSGICQDYALTGTTITKDGEEVLIIAVSDGAGSAPASHHGSKRACSSFLLNAIEFVSNRKNLRNLNDASAKTIITQVQQDLHHYAAEQNLKPQDLACTLVAAIVSANHSLFIQIGDGSSVYTQNDQYHVAIWPENGEFVNETIFITEPKALNHIQTKKVNGSIDSVFLFSDGLQFLVLDFKSMTPHAPFFNSLNKALSKQPPGRSELISSWLKEKILDSPAVLSKTDDDLSIAIARKVPCQEQP